MTRKIYDIFPPNHNKEVKPLQDKERVRRSDTVRKRNPVKFIALITFLFLIVLALNWVFLKVNIDIWPEIDLTQYSGVIEVRTDQYHTSIEPSVIPGKIFTTKIEESKTFSVSGRDKDERRAEGVLRVYNNYSELPQTLINETRFVSADGKLFRSTESVTVPGKTGSIPGQADVMVRAVESGEDYNIDKTSKFSIPGLQGTAMYMDIYAENPKPITGGFIGESPIILESDVEAAKELLFSSAIESAKKDLTGLAPGYLFDEKLMKIDLVTEFVRPTVGERFDSFDYTIEIEVKSFSFKESDLKDFLKKVLLDSVDDHDLDPIFSKIEIWEDSLIFSYEEDIRKIDEGSITLEIESSAIAYPLIRKELVKREISKMKIGEAYQLLSSYDRIKSVEIKTRPSWLKKMPVVDKIEIETVIDK